MRVILLLTAIVVAVNANLSNHEKWMKFKVEYGKNYNLVEEKLRFEIFQDNVRKIEEHNRKYEQGESTYYLKANRFADMTPEEIKNFLKLKVTMPTSVTPLKLDENYVRPSAVDWREKNAVGPVKDQGSCGGCWAFTTTGSLEGLNRIHYQNNASLSEQELLDCVENNVGCDGGDLQISLRYVKWNGLSTEEQYPYAGKDTLCKTIKNRPFPQISNFDFLEENEDALADGVATKGPIMIAISVDYMFQSYGGGVFDDKYDGQFNHGVLVVGYTDDYWIVKNSWGSNWGEDGFIRVKRGKHVCRIGEYSLYADL